jgi:hypothetical protein
LPYFITHVSGPRSSKRVITDPGQYETALEAEEIARVWWPDGDYFIVEAGDHDQARKVAIAESRALD